MVSRVSIRPAAGIGGSVMTDLAGHRIVTRSQVDRLLKVLLAGRGAEQTVLNRVSAGAGGDEDSDLARATWLAASAYGAFGLGDGEDGVVWLGFPEPKDMPQFLLMRPLLAKCVAAKLASTYSDVLEFLRRNRHVVEHIARALIVRGVIDGGELAALIAEARQPGGIPSDPGGDDISVRQP